MTIKPIDLQTNVAHMHEIAKSEQGRSVAYVEGQHKLEKNSAEEARRIRSRLEENKHAEKTSIKREEKHGYKKDKRLHQEEDEDEKKTDGISDSAKSESIGLNIDVKI